MVWQGDEEKNRWSRGSARDSPLWIQLHQATRVSFAAVAEVEGRRTTQVSGVAAMNVNVLPLAVALVPYARLLRLVSVSVALPAKRIDERNSICTKVESSLINVLRQSDVGNAGRFIAQQVNVRVEDGRVDGLAVLSQYCKLQLKLSIEAHQEQFVNFTVFEIEFMEIHALDQIAQRLRLKCGQMWITYFTASNQLID